MREQLTKSDVKKIEEEIEYRRLVLRKELIESVKEARAQGDLSENFEYHAAKKEKNKNESRIRYLERMLKTASVISDESKMDEVGLNNRVTVYFEDDDEEEVYKLVTSVRGNSLKNYISIESPIGKAIRGAKVGDRVYVKVNENAGYYLEIRAIEKSDDEAEDMSLSENLQREQVRPTEEAKAFKRLLEKGRYDMYSLVSRFGRSEKYIYTRLKLNELYAPIGELLDNETITVSVAEEISTYEPDIQKDVYEKHLKEGNGEDWTGYTLNLFKRYFEKYYTTDLGQYKFDKTECKTCVHNAANYNLFAEHNGCGHCTNRKCLEAKNAAHVAKETEKLLKSDPKLVVARPYYGSRNDMALQKLDKKGHEIKELDYNVSAREFPKAPEAPKKEQFTQAKEYEQAVQTFERRNEEYARKVEELDRMKEEGRIKTYVKVGQTEPELCYVEINRKETAPVTIGCS